MTWSLADELLDQAEHLATWPEGSPTQASLRRAISAAYYALFHELSYMCCDALVGETKEWQHIRPLYRALEHSAPKRYLSCAPKLPIDPKVKAVIDLFNQLQQQRHLADYDPAFRPVFSSTVTSINQAKTGIESIRDLTRNEKLIFAVNLIGRPRAPT